MDKQTSKPPQNEDHFTDALADVLLYLRRRREAREAQRTAGADNERGTNE
jgi:hypothetical protein